MQTSSTSPLPASWVSRIFREMQGNYGARFLHKWKTGQMLADGTDAGIANAMEIWAVKLAGFRDQPDAIKRALENLPSEPPDLPVFVGMCRDELRRLAANAPALPYTPTQEDLERAAKAARDAVQAIQHDAGRDHLLWARVLKKRHDAGEVVTPLQIEFYRAALGIVDVAV